MFDLSKFSFNNCCYFDVSNILMPTFNIQTFSLPNLSLFGTYSFFPSFNIGYLPNFPVFPNFLSFNNNFYIQQPLYPLFNFKLFNNNIFYKKEEDIKEKEKPERKSIVQYSKPKLTNKTDNKTDKKIDNSYVALSQKQAEQKAKNDENLEFLKGGNNWSVDMNSFLTDIPYAKKGTGQILDKVSSMIGEQLVITSALGTGESGNPHKRGGYASHHNAENPKLDIRISGNGKELARKLKSTGYFSRVSVEKDHLDVQIDSSKYKDFEVIA